MSVRLFDCPSSWHKSVPTRQVVMQYEFWGSLKVCRQNSRLIKIGEQRVPYKRPKCIYNHNHNHNHNHNLLNYLNNEKYFREISAGNKNTYFVYPTKFSECLSFDKFVWKTCYRQTDRQTGWETGRPQTLTHSLP